MLTNRSFPPSTTNPISANQSAHSRRLFLKSCSLVVLGVAMFGGCSAETVGGSNEYIIQADTMPDDGFFVRLPSGRIFVDPDSFLSEAPTEFKQAHDAGQRLEIQLGARASNHIAGAMTDEKITEGSGEANFSARQSALYQQIGNLVITGDWGWGYVSGCVKQTTIKYAFRCNDKFTGTQYFDLHIAFWRQGTKVCVGLYESVRQLVNRCTCDPGEQNRIYQELLEMLSRARISPSTAAVIAALLTAAAYALLAFV